MAFLGVVDTTQVQDSIHPCQEIPVKQVNLLKRRLVVVVVDNFNPEGEGGATLKELDGVVDNPMDRLCWYSGTSREGRPCP